MEMHDEQLMQLLQNLNNEKDKNTKYFILKELGSLYIEIGDINKAINYYEQALNVAKELEDALAQKVVFGKLAEAYLRLNENDKAIGYYKQGTSVNINESLNVGDTAGSIYAGKINDWKSLSQKEVLSKFSEVLKKQKRIFKFLISFVTFLAIVTLIVGFIFLPNSSGIFTIIAGLANIIAAIIAIIDINKENTRK